MHVNVRLEDCELRRGDDVIYVTVTAEQVEVEFDAGGAHASDPAVIVACMNCRHPVPVTDDEVLAIERVVCAAAEAEAEASWEDVPRGRRHRYDY